MPRGRERDCPDLGHCRRQTCIAGGNRSRYRGRSPGIRALLPPAIRHESRGIPKARQSRPVAGACGLFAGATAGAIAGATAGDALGEGTVSGVPRRCFIAAPAETNVSTLISALKERGWEGFALADFAPLGASLTEALRQSISSADVVIALLGAESRSADTLYEIGVATGMGKPVMIVAPKEAEVPSDLASFLQVRAEPNNAEAIAFALDNLDRYTRKTDTTVGTQRGSGQPLGPYAQSLLEEAQSGELSEAERQSLLMRAIDASGAVAAMSPPGRNLGFDIGVWFDALDAIAANPLLVVLRPRLNDQSVRQCMLALHQAPGARAGLIVFEEASGGGPVDGLNWPVLAISLEDLLSQMRERSFAEVVRSLRNRSVHGGNLP